MGTLIVGIVLISIAIGAIWFLSAEYFSKIGSFFIHLAKPFKQNSKEEENE